MAGAGYKLFNTGDVLTAAQVNTYLQEQTVMVFADSAARTTALSGVLAEGMMSYLQDTNAVEVYNGTSWVNVGNAGDITEVQAGVGISIASGTGPIPVITNSSTDLITTAGDLLYGTAADTMARLGIGTAGQVLKVNSGATAPEWGAAAGGSSGLTLISRQTLSAAASVSFDGVFTSTYQAYICIIEDLLSSSQFNLDMRLKYSTNTEVTTGYYGTSFDGATQTDTSNGSAFRMSQGGISSDTGEFSNMHILFSPMNKSGRGVVSGFGAAGKTNKPISFMGVSTDVRTYTGCSFFLSAGNMTGTFSMYGLAKS